MIAGYRVRNSELVIYLSLFRAPSSFSISIPFVQRKKLKKLSLA